MKGLLRRVKGAAVPNPAVPTRNQEDHMKAPQSWWAKPFGNKDNQFPALTDEEREEILQHKPVTRCPDARVVVTFRQQLSRNG